MTFELLEAIRLFVSGKRQESLAAARHCRSNGYKDSALKHENEAAMAKVILDRLSKEHDA
jgi:hypothetical protein